MLTDLSVRRRRRAVLALGVVLAVTLAIVTLRLAAGGPQRRSPDGPPSDRPAPSVPVPTATTEPDSAADPETFATSVAHGLFDWDTTAGQSREEYVGALLALADPTGAESAGLAADVAAYLPTPETWDLLTGYYTRQWIEIRSVAEPDLWPQAVAEAGAGGLAPGTAAFTVAGVRHREGVWDGADVASAHEVAFTVFVVCGPTYATCHLLRLSRLDDPLD